MSEQLTEADLTYAAYDRCPCGAGLAYTPKNTDPFKGYWDCSDILLERAKTKDEPGYIQHTAQLPFIFYEIKSEDQPSANGATTRPATEEQDEHTTSIQVPVPVVPFPFSASEVTSELLSSLEVTTDVPATEEHNGDTEPELPVIEIEQEG